MKRQYDWLNRKKILTVDNLRPWSDNPRLNPEESHISILDYAEDMISESKSGFLGLLRSISDSGFLPFDPIVVWQDKSNKKYYVAEGNRRLIALKILRDPNKSPKSIRGTVRKYAAKMDLDGIRKIGVYVVPTFDEAEWYINQRNSTSSLQRKWSTIQQLRWVSQLYKKYDGDITKLLPVISLDEGQLNSYIRILKMWEYVSHDCVKSKLTPEVFELASSYRFPISVLERFFSSATVREHWHIEFIGNSVKINSDLESFYTAFAELIRRIVKPSDDETKIDTRTITTHIDQILDELPDVVLQPSLQENNDVLEEGEENMAVNEVDPSTGTEVKPSSTNPSFTLKNDPNRNRLVLNIYELNTDSARLAGLFNEFKRIPVNSYPNSVAASLRVFLDLSILNYIRREGLNKDISAHFSRSLREIPLKTRIDYIKTNKLSGSPNRIAMKLLDNSQQFSLDVLNGFVHSQDTHYMSKQNLNRFWDFLFPLFEHLLDIQENV